MTKYFLVASLLMASCATRTALVPLDYKFVDMPAEGKIEFTYQNTSRSTMCLLPESWPNLGGKINQAGDKVSLIVGKERLPLEDFNTGHCTEGCAQRVAPGSTISAFIAYKDFNLPERLINESKKLELSPVGYKCSAIGHGEP